jgi:outer membrane receptor for ferrienterochelin and colicin
MLCRNRFGRLGAAILAVLILATPAAAQGNPTGTISGRVVQQDGAVLPGATVTATSPALQGARTVTTSDNGDFILPFLPAGEYTVRIELAGFKNADQKVNVAVAQTVPLDVALDIASVSEAVTVTARTENFAQTAPLATTFRADLVDKLPSDRSLNATMLLAPNVSATGPSTNNNDSASQSIVVAGAMSFENLFLINGVSVNENIRGQAVPLFIEDAIQETTVTSGSVSAEFGRFSGGVVNAITKSGGNSFSGSFRTTFTNDDWRALSPQQGDRKVDDTIPTYEFTLGGPVLRDRLWFFSAGRFVDRIEARQLDFTNSAFDFGNNEKRYEGKGTYSLTSGHTFRGSYIGRRRAETNARFTGTMDERSLYDRKLPEDLYSANYTGIITKNFFVEAQYSKRTLTFDGAGSSTTDIIQGTLVIDNARAGRYWSPTFCSVCAPPEERNNEDVLMKGTYFLSTSNMGSHNLVFGYDTFNDIRTAKNHQSGSDYRILGTTSIIRDGVIYPSWTPGTSTTIQWNPITNNSLGTDFRTHSVFVNDQWRLSDRLSFNVGIRYDKNDGKDSGDAKVIDDAAFSPRLSATWDPTGSGRWTLNASYGRYVAGIANSVADSASAGGAPAQYRFRYDGPGINTDINAPTAALVPTDVALRTLFDWFFANGGTNRPTTLLTLPGVNTRIDGTLKSPSVQEFAGGVTRQLGSRGAVRVDALYRKYGDFYMNRRDTVTGRVIDPAGQPQDLTVVQNGDLPKREHAALSAQGSYRFNTRLQAGANYTLSHTWGNLDGENQGSGPVPAERVTSGSAGTAGTGFLYLPEYNDPAWNRPEGDLAVDQRHRAHLWATYNTPIPASVGSLTLGALHVVNSGLPYGAIGLVSVNSVPNPGYVNPATTAAYFFTERDAFRTEVVNRTDLSATYAYRFGAGAAQPEVFFQVQLWNVFNNQGIADANNISVTTQTATGGTAGLTQFNPFLETPVEGVHWRKAPRITAANGTITPGFGEARNRFAYQTPRTLRLSMGIRF